MSPEHFFRRDTGLHVKTYDHIHDAYFPSIARGALVNGDLSSIPTRTRDWWEGGRELYASSREGSRSVHLGYDR